MSELSNPVNTVDRRTVAALFLFLELFGQATNSTTKTGC